jgi:hypothetical protein
MLLDDVYKRAQYRARRTPSVLLRRTEREIVARARLSHPGDIDLARLAAARYELQRRERPRSESRSRPRWRFWRFAP